MNLSNLFGELSRRDAQRALAARFPFAHFNTGGDGVGGGGAGGGDDKDKAFLERRTAELEGMAVEALRAQVLRLETDNRSQRAEIKSLKDSSKASEGEKTELEAYRAFGKPDELKGKLDSAEKTAAEVVNYKRLEVVGKAAGISKLNGERLAEIVKLKGLDLEIGEGLIEKDGKPEKGEVVYVKGSDGKPIAFSDYVKTDLSSFAEWLSDTGAAKGGAGTKVAPQSPGQGGGGQTNEALSVLEKRLAGNSGQQTSTRFDPLAPSAVNAANAAAAGAGTGGKTT